MAALQGGYADRGGAGAAAVGLTLPCASRRMLCGMPPRQCEKLQPCALKFRRSAKQEGWPDEVRLRAGRSAEGFGYNTRNTARAVLFFPISGRGPDRDFVLAHVLFKRAAAVANHQAGWLDDTLCNAIVAACDKLLAGDPLAQ